MEEVSSILGNKQQHKISKASFEAKIRESKRARRRESKFTSSPLSFPFSAQSLLSQRLLLLLLLQETIFLVKSNHKGKKQEEASVPHTASGISSSSTICPPSKERKRDGFGFGGGEVSNGYGQPSLAAWMRWLDGLCGTSGRPFEEEQEEISLEGGEREM